MGSDADLRGRQALKGTSVRLCKFWREGAHQILRSSRGPVGSRLERQHAQRTHSAVKGTASRLPCRTGPTIQLCSPNPEHPKCQCITDQAAGTDDCTQFLAVQFHSALADHLLSTGLAHVASSVCWSCACQSAGVHTHIKVEELALVTVLGLGDCRPPAQTRIEAS